MKPKCLLSWSSGKDSAWTLHVLRQLHQVEVVGLVTTFRAEFDRVAMHAVRRPLVEAQARAVGMPLWPVPLPSPCTNDAYEEAMSAVIRKAKGHDVSHFAFGDLFLEDIRAYRQRQFAGSGVEPLFPLWTAAEHTPSLARDMLRQGLRAVLTCVDPRQIDAGFVGRPWDERLLAELPAGADPCGERGEFHTFCHAGPMFTADVPVDVGERCERDGFAFVDLLVPKSPT